jgi:hypothetical protein
MGGGAFFCVGCLGEQHTKLERHDMNIEHSGGKKAIGSRERRFVLWASVGCLAYVGSFLAVLFLFPQTRPRIFVPYSIVLAAGIVWWNRRQSAIRREEQSDV